MVAARPANQALDASLASELGSLCHAHVHVVDPRARLEALLALAPMFVRLELRLDWLRARVRAAAAAGVCPDGVRGELVAVVVDGLEREAPAALALVADALWSRSDAVARTRGVLGALGLGAVAAARELARCAGALRPRLARAIELGYLAPSSGPAGVPRFAGDVRARGAEDAFARSLPLAIAIVDAAVTAGDEARVPEAERVIAALRPAERAIGAAHLARAALRFGGTAAALARLRGIRADGIRAGAGLLVVDQAVALGDLDAAAQVAAAITAQRFAQRAQLVIARALVDRGAHVAALRRLARVDQPALLPERCLMHDEIRLRVWGDLRRVILDPVMVPEAPAWTHVVPPVPVDLRRCIVDATQMLATSLRARCWYVVDDGAARLVALASHRPALAALCQLCEATGVDLDLVHLARRCRGAGRALDALAAVRTARRADLLARAGRDAVAPFALGLAGVLDAPMPRDGRAPERALFDEGLALSPVAPRRRRVLVDAARACVRAALAAPAAWPTATVEARVRTLVYLGARDVLERLITNAASGGAHLAAAITGLAALDARAAAAVVLRGLPTLAAAGVDVPMAVRMIESLGGVERGYATAFEQAWDALAKRRGALGAAAWLLDLETRYRAHAGAAPGTAILDRVSQRWWRADEVTPAELVAELTSVDPVLLADDHVAVAEALVRDPDVLGRVVVARPPRVEARLWPWSDTQWHDVLRRAVGRSRSVIDPEVVEHCAGLLGRRDAVAALRSGDLARLGVATRTELAVDGARFRLRLLDKRLDLLTYLRFADVAARSCFHSQEHGWTERDRLDAWRDPLTFCLHVERIRHAAAEPRGFLFGGFAVVGGELRIVLNSLHVRPRSAAVRAAVLAAFERAVAVPLGIRRIGIANLHGGRGPLPADYVRADVALIRLRALAHGGEPLLETYDDIAFVVNSPVKADHLRWKTVAPATASARRAGC
jgi:hypothetical protein